MSLTILFGFRALPPPRRASNMYRFTFNTDGNRNFFSIFPFFSLFINKNFVQMGETEAGELRNALQK